MSFHISRTDKLFKCHKRKRIYIMVPSMPDMALKKKISRAKPLGLSYLTNAAKGNPSRKIGNKNWSEDGLFGIEQAI